MEDPTQDEFWMDMNTLAGLAQTICDTAVEAKQAADAGDVPRLNTALDDLDQFLDEADTLMEHGGYAEPEEPEFCETCGEPMQRDMFQEWGCVNPLCAASPMNAPDLLED